MTATGLNHKLPYGNLPRLLADQVSMTKLMKSLDEFLERDQDRALFGLQPKPDVPPILPKTR